VDFRVDADGRPYVLEINPNPCISPQAGLAAALETARVPYSEFALSLVRSALRRGPRPELADAVGTGGGAAIVPAADDTPTQKGWKVRPARASDAGNLFDLITVCDALSPEERAAVTRRLRQRFRRRDRGGATVLLLAGRGRVGGFAVLGPTDPVQGGFGLEALVVEPSLRRCGFGRLLLARAEAAAAAAGGRVLTADVSSGSAAAAVRQFLTRVGYRPAGELPEFYRDGSSRLTFAKSLPAAPAGQPKPASTVASRA